MKFKEFFTKENIKKALKSLGVIRFQISRSTLFTAALVTLVVFIAFMIRILPIRWGLELSEFDPFFQYRFTKYIEENGFFSWLNWHDPQRWYPWGVDVGKAAFPGLPMTVAFIHTIIAALGIPIQLYEFCVLWPAIMGAVSCLMMYFLAKDIGGKTVGIFSALFLALSSSYITRTSLGFYDDETIGIFAMLLFAFLFLRSIDKERTQNSSLMYAVAAGLALGYFTAGWGAALYPIAMTTLYVFVLIITKRYSQRLLVSYSITYGLGLFIAVHVPKLSISFLSNWAVFPAFGIFALLCLCEILNQVKSTKWKLIYTVILLLAIIGGFVALSLLGVIGSPLGKFISVLNPFERLAAPLIESVQEHRVSAWGSFYYDFGIGVIFFAVGLFFALKNLTHRNIFLIVYGLTSLYFAGSMVRLIVLLAPAFGILAATGVVGILRPFIAIIKEKPKIQIGKKYTVSHVGKEFSGLAILVMFGLLTITFAFPAPRMFASAYSPVTLLSSSIPIKTETTMTEWRDALIWMRDNLPKDAVVCSWWDYGYWITIYANKTTLADNATSNSTQIANIGWMFVSNETEAYYVLTTHLHKPDYIVVFATFMQKDGTYAGFGDEGKWIWMAKISAQYSGIRDTDQYVYKKYQVNETGLWEPKGQEVMLFNKTAGAWSPQGQETMIYRLMAYGRDSVASLYGWTAGGTSLPAYLEKEHFFSETKPPMIDLYGGVIPLVCIYKVIYKE
jgi:dolichyl-diphosphooligosaccharide--protein glycosyltransferase